MSKLTPVSTLASKANALRVFRNGTPVPELDELRGKEKQRTAALEKEVNREVKLEKKEAAELLYKQVQRQKEKAKQKGKARKRKRTGKGKGNRKKRKKRKKREKAGLSRMQMSGSGTWTILTC